jgi:hypothetical protein
VGLQQGLLGLVITIEELLGRTSSGCGLESREYGCEDPLRWPRDTLYPQKSALTSPTSGGRSVGIVLSRTHAMEFLEILVAIIIVLLYSCGCWIRDELCSTCSTNVKCETAAGIYQWSLSLENTETDHR